MSNSEHQIDVVRNVMNEYDLYLTSERLIAIRSQFKKYNFSFWGAFIGVLIGIDSIVYGNVGTAIGVSLAVVAVLIGGLIGAGMDKVLASRNKMKYEQLKGLTLDDLLKRNSKNFAFSYEHIEKLKFHRYGLRLVLDIISEESRKRIGLTTAQFTQLNNVLSSVDALKGKIEK